MERKRKRKYVILVLGLAALLAVSAGMILHAQKPYVPVNRVDRMEVSRSQVYLSGKGYTIDKKQAKNHDRVEKARTKKITREEQRKEKENSSSRREKDDSSAVKTNTHRGGKEPGSGRTDDPEAPDADHPEDVNNRSRDSDDEKDLTDEEKAELPIISTSLVNGDEVSGKYRRFWVTATDYKGRNIPVYSVGDGSFTVSCNGTKLRSTGASENKTYFRPALRNGKNTFKITATDRRGKQRTITRWITCDTEKEAEKTGKVQVRVTASIIGLGTLTTQTVDITEGESVEEILKTALGKGGYNYVITRGYLAAIGRHGITDGWHISEATRKKLEKERATEQDPDKQNRNQIREKDFYNTSGWLYSVNGEIQGVGIGSCVPADGDEIHVFFALSRNVY